MTKANYTCESTTIPMAAYGDSYYGYYRVGAFYFKAPRYRPPHAARL